MLIRFNVKNVFSFGTLREFNMIPRPRLTRFHEHKYSINNFELLKLTALYGANGAGKSNLVKALDIFKDIVTEEEFPFRHNETVFKFLDNDKDKIQLFAVEFIEGNKAFYYALELFEDIVLTEELYYSGLGKKKDQLLYERHTSKNGKINIKFFDEFEKDEKNRILKSILIEEFVKPNMPILKLLSKRDNKYLRDIKEAYNWFDKSLIIIRPDSKPGALAHKIDKDVEFKHFAENFLKSFNLGISSIKSIKKSIKEFFGEDNENELEDIIKDFKQDPEQILGFVSRTGDEIVVVKENNQIVVKQLKLEHKGKDSIIAQFFLDEESDGTIRLLDFIPVFKNIITKNKVYIIDEIERSIHPLLIKEIIEKFSSDFKTHGQLIFTTHESNLLDQNIFRQDEIWFAEKDNNGETDLYSLSDFKEHNTIDIRKGYLNGRYGSIPFLANLKDLNWHEYAIVKE